MRATPPVVPPVAAAPPEPAIPQAQQERAVAQVVAHGVGPTWEQYFALLATTILAVAGIVTAVLALGFTPGVLVPGNDVSRTRHQP